MTQKPWTPEENQELTLRSMWGEPDSAIARAMGRSTSSVTNRRRRLKVGKPLRYRLAPCDCGCGSTVRIAKRRDVPGRLHFIDMSHRVRRSTRRRTQQGTRHSRDNPAKRAIIVGLRKAITKDGRAAVEHAMGVRPKDTYYYERGDWTYLDSKTVERLQRVVPIDLADPQVRGLIHTPEVQAQVAKDSVVVRQKRYSKDPRGRERAIMGMREKLTGRKNPVARRRQRDKWNWSKRFPASHEKAKAETLRHLRTRQGLPSQRIEQGWLGYVRRRCRGRVPTEEDAERFATWVSRDLHLDRTVVGWVLDRVRQVPTPRGPRRGPLPDIDLAFVVREIRTEHPAWELEQIAPEANRRLGRAMFAHAIEAAFSRHKRWLLPPPPRPDSHDRLWTEADIAYLREHHSHETHAQIAEALRRTPKAVESECIRLGLVTRRLGTSRPWTQAEDAYLLDHPQDPLRQLAQHLDGRTLWAVNARRRHLGLKKRLVQVTRNTRRPHYQRWTDSEDARLRRCFTRMTRPQIARKFGRTVASIDGRCAYLGLTKTTPA